MIMENKFFDIYEKLIEYKDLDDTTKEKIHLNVFNNFRFRAKSKKVWGWANHKRDSVFLK